MSDPTTAPAPRRRWWPRVLLVAGLLALAGLGVFAGMLWSWTDIEELDPAAAERAFADARVLAGGGEPYLEMPERGDVIVHHEREKGGEWRILGLHGLIWVAERGRMIRFDVPGWFVRTKMRATVRFESFLGATGVEFDEPVEVSTEDLRRFGHGIVLDGPFEDGGRILVWQEAERE